MLIVLKIIQLEENDFKPDDFTLDDKELLNEFDKGKMDAEKVRKFTYTLLKARFFLDNYIVHRTNEEETLKNNPWKLQKVEKQENEWILKNLCTKKTDEETQKDDNEADDRASTQNKLINLLSMFEVSFTARQRKNYLLYCILYLLKCPQKGPDLYVKYTNFLENLANSYFVNIYMDVSKLNEINTPKPGSFDEVVLMDNKLSIQDNMTKPYCVTAVMFNNIYGDGEEKSKGVPLFVFNYLDYKIWKLYDDEVRGKQLGKNDEERMKFFAKLGCSDFDLLPFKQFYFSRTRRSLEHFFPQAKVHNNELANKEDNNTPSKNQINCLGNYAMIGSEANSSGSNWDSITKVTHYMDNKIKQVSVASLKFKIMMQICKDNKKWEFKEIQEHQRKMVALLTGDSGENIES